MATARVRDTLDSIGTPYYKNFKGVIETPNQWQTLIQDTVPANISRALQRVIICCRMEANFIVKVDDDIIGSGRTGGTQSVVPFDWVPAKKILAGKVLRILFCSRPNLPMNLIDVEAYLQASDQVTT